MNIHRVGRVLLKVLTCSVGGAIAGLIVYVLVLYGRSVYGGDQIEKNCVLIGVGVGLITGICWAITQREVRIALFKVLTCSVGGAMAGLIVYVLVFDDAWVYEGGQVALNYALTGVGVGLITGICWAITQREVRIVFATPTVLGLIVSLVTLIFVFGNSGLGDRLFFVLIMAFPVGLFIGIVWSLLRAGIFGNKND